MKINKTDGALYEEIYGWASDLFPICRSITGQGVRETLAYIQKIVPGLVVHEVPTGTKAFDWIVPDEWNISEAFIQDPDGKRIVDFRENNLHIVGYSVPTDVTLNLDELEKHLYSIPERPNAIPYITSYYEKRWGFCIPHKQRQKLKPGLYRAVVNSTLMPGFLTYGEIILPGREKSEILLSTYVCHPSLANNEISGPVVATALARWLGLQTERRHTYRIIFGPETIGSIVYISRHLEHLKKHVIAGFNISCVGDNSTYSYLASRNSLTLADRVARHVLGHLAPGYVSYSYQKRGSDERQYCAPGVDLPVVSVMRTRYGDYPEYHTSDDNLDVISPEGLGGAFNALKHCIMCLEKNEIIQSKVLCEPQFSRRKLILTLGGGTEINEKRRNLNSILAYADGQVDFLEIAETVGVPMWELIEAKEILEREDLIEIF